MYSVRFINRDRLSVITGGILLTVVLSRLLELPTRSLLTITVLGSPIGFTISAMTLLQLILLGLSLTGIVSLLQSHPLAQLRMEWPYLFWIIPGLLGIGLGTWLNQIQALTGWLAALLVCVVLVPLMFTIEYNSVDPAERQGSFMMWAQQGIVHLTAVLWFVLIYEARLRSLLSGTAVLFISVLLAIRLLWLHESSLTKAVQHSLLVGLGIAQMTWVLNYGQLSGLQGGLCLFLLFYVLVGLVQQSSIGQWDDGQNGRRVLLEYGGVTIISLLFIFFAVS